ncbi:MAG: hypothetical protein UR80_C0011G0004 [Parcubacteria group bacterium GW2011_GWB1_35_5]|uniref:Uncharacterized protein n=1 Tax=Candidatus Zambryskibacteria bacterium RIFCSPLOWO2_01_FULL_35_19 TaxID=1802757 RepID=A0A1G2TXM8_9BACT|nr:MAG: hypothetical protein UR80_C0011G0004 [Parcubacteria group bacterium GW2011_GWB1_35_5]OHA86440.1 MAG: hypothetical protein A2726_01380 [Candidatus Zambryskibacteria bacterium RIFCSPHIGHO2_01_FULL_35_32]OHB01322.1 MAG: hypothetical protein A3A90_00390 [Candidatus Zambryskibacteria bacterium RIFCSPLOWO2_01_FULL_35_19]
MFIIGNWFARKLFLLLALWLLIVCFGEAAVQGQETQGQTVEESFKTPANQPATIAGLSPEEIEAQDEMNRVKKARAVGLPDNATWVQIYEEEVENKTSPPEKVKEELAKAKNFFVLVRQTIIYPFRSLSH